MLVPTLDNLRVDGREVDLAELQEVLVGPLEHVHDCSPFVRDPRERDDGHPLYGLASGGHLLSPSKLFHVRDSTTRDLAFSTNARETANCEGCGRGGIGFGGAWGIVRTGGSVSPRQQPTRTECRRR